ncbi:hypothetical protein BASA81_007853 [Batrachochytrium salamandrivorans]|nr:hypothetical protein BASA81_007853 [Batrachochytrium salamandrivorans]
MFPSLLAGVGLVLLGVLVAVSFAAHPISFFSPILVTQPLLFPPSLSPTQPASSSWRWTKPRRNIMFTKIPKTGSTTLFEVLNRVAEHSPGWRMAVPSNNASKVNTCTTLPIGKQAWSQMVRDNGGRIDMFASHACYRKSYMAHARSWSQKKPPVAITMMRHPLSHFVSKFRFAKVCCIDQREWDWCQAFCTDAGPYTVERYVDYACGNGMCNEQKRYMGEGSTKTIIDSFFLVLILERFDESLALLGVKLGLPTRALPYLQENANTLVPKPVISDEYREELESKHMEYDVALYRVATQRLDSMLAELTTQEREEYDEVLHTLRFANQRAANKCKPLCEAELELSTQRKVCLDRCLTIVMEEIWGREELGPVPSPTAKRPLSVSHKGDDEDEDNDGNDD